LLKTISRRGFSSTFVTQSRVTEAQRLFIPSRWTFRVA
jgi:hypothetical protein